MSKPQEKAKETVQDRPDFISGVDWIDRHPWFIAIGRDIADGDPWGAPCDDLEAFDDLDGEMMKRGTLRHGDIRWDWVAEQSTLLLADHAKDLRLLLFLIHAAPVCVADRDPLCLAANITARFLTRWLDMAFPTGKGRALQVTRVVDALETMVARAVETGAFTDTAATGAALKRCADVVAESAPDLGIRLAVLPSRFEKKPEPPAPATAAEDTAANRKTDRPPGQSAPAAPSPSSPRSDSLRLDANNERALKQSLTVVADFLLGLDVRHPLSYRLRRFATWYGIASTPPIKTGERTVVPPVSDDVSESYRIAADRGQPDDDIVKKLERSCHLQPFWIEGQWLAWRLATACGRSDAADAIRSETARFVGGIKALHKLKFADGSPLISATVRDWLGTETGRKGKGAEAGAPDPAAADAPQQVVRAARENARGGNLAAAMETLDKARPQARGQRAATLWELHVLECLSDWGMKEHAGVQAARLSASIDGLPVKDWEPDILDRLKRLTG